MIEQPNPYLRAAIHDDFGCARPELGDGSPRTVGTTEQWQDFHVALRRGVERIREAITGITINVDDGPEIAETTVAIAAEDRTRRAIDSIIGLLQTMSNLVQEYSNR